MTIPITQRQRIHGSKFYTKSGWLTWYSLACGYIEVAVRGQVTLHMWHEGGPCIHVRAHDHEAKGRLFWDVYETVTDARIGFRRAMRELNLERL